MVLLVAAFGEVDHQTDLLGAADVDRDRHRGLAAANHVAGILLLAIGKYAERDAAATGRGGIDRQFGGEPAIRLSPIDR